MNKNSGVSAVIGVILMVAITVAIASTVYVYVSNMMLDVDFKPDMVIEGRVDYIYSRGIDNRTIIILDKGRSYDVYNELSFFDGIEKDDIIRFYFHGENYVDDWKHID